METKSVVDWFSKSEYVHWKKKPGEFYIQMSAQNSKSECQQHYRLIVVLKHLSGLLIAAHLFHALPLQIVAHH